MDRQTKRTQREQAILRHAIALFVEKGFLGVRMSDVAGACRLSMGTIYSHFAAKEDLLTGCATLLIGEELAIFERIIGLDRPAITRIVTGFTANWLISEHHPALVEIEHLSLMPSIWRRAVPDRVARLTRLHADFFQRAQRVVLELLEAELEGYADLDRSAREELALLLNHGMWGLCVGLNSTAHSFVARAVEESAGAPGGVDGCSYRHFTTNVIHFLKGCGWREEYPQRVFAACRAEAEAILAASPWFAGSAPKREEA